MFLPHDHTVPSFFNACIVSEPADICITSVRFGTCLNSVESVVVPSPNCPYVLFPDIHTVPSFFNIAVKYSPAVTSTAFSTFVFVGSDLFVWSPVPNCPFPLYPHVHTVPSDFSPTKWLYPPTIFGYVTPSSAFTFIFTTP